MRFVKGLFQLLQLIGCKNSPACENILISSNMMGAIDQKIVIFFQNVSLVVVETKNIYRSD